MIKIFLHKDNFDLIENGVSTFSYNNFDKIINELLKENKKFKVYNEKTLPIREAKIVKLKDDTYRILYAFDWRKSICSQEKYTYFKDLETKNYALKQYQSLDIFSYSSHEVYDIFNNLIILFTI